MIELTAKAALHHSLKAILFADAAGYSRLVVENEGSTLDLMRRCFRVMRALAAEHNGELIKTTGDGAVLTFDSALSAIGCAVEAQKQFARVSQPFAEELRVQFRIGIHLGEVTYEDGDVYGHCVNVASRLQALAPPGGIYISEIVTRQLQKTGDWTYRNLGPKRLKNIAEPVNVFEVHGAKEGRDSGDSEHRFSISICRGFLLSRGFTQNLHIGSRHARALIGYLALKQGNFEFRDRLASMLWSQMPPKHSQTALRACLTALRRSLKDAYPDLVSHDDDIIRLNQISLQTDVDRLLDELTHGQVSDALVEGEIIPEHLMYGFEDVDSAFGSWLQIARHNWRTKLISRLEESLLGEDVPNELQARSAQALRLIDPTHEPAYRCLMQVQAMKGNLPGAARLYEDLKTRLADAFHLVPSPETQRLFDAIQQRTFSVAGPIEEPHTSLSRLPRIQIMRFSAGQSDESVRYLMTGLRSELVDSLVRFREWIILDEGPNNVASGEVSAATGSMPVDYFVQALCEKGHAGFSLKLTLSEAETRRYVWSEAYDVTLSDWSRTRGEIVKQIAARLGIYLSTGRVMSNSGGNDTSLTAYDKWLKGQHLLSLWEPDAEQEAKNLFEAVINELPDFAPAYASLADIHNVAHLINVGVARDPVSEGRAADLARHAVSIDPLNAKAQLALAWSLTMAGQYEQAELHFDMATELNPYDLATLVSSAQGMAFVDRCEVAKLLAQQASQITPLLSGYQHAYLATTRFLCGDFKGCLEASAMAGTAIVDVPVWKTAALQQLGERDLARVSGEEMLRHVKRSWKGDPGLNDTQMINWVVDAYPLKNIEKKKFLKHALIDVIKSF